MPHKFQREEGTYMQEQQIKEEEIEEESKDKPDVQKSWMKRKHRKRDPGGDRRRQVGRGKKKSLLCLVFGKAAPASYQRGGNY